MNAFWQWVDAKLDQNAGGLVAAIAAALLWIARVLFTKISEVNELKRGMGRLEEHVERLDAKMDQKLDQQTEAIISILKGR